VDRDRLADIVYLVRDLEGYEGVYETRGPPSIVITNDRARARAAARVTALEGVDLNIVMTCSTGTRLDVTSADMVAAAARDAKRREAWAAFEIVRLAQRQSRRLMVVSASAERYAAAIASMSFTPIDAFGVDRAERVMTTLGATPLPDVIVFDVSIEDVFPVCRRVRDAYPRRFAGLESVHWIAGRDGLLESDVENILSALGTRMRPTPRPNEPFASVRVLVIADVRTLEREVSLAAPGARVEHADGWTALERLDAARFDLVVAGEVTDIGLASLVRIVAGCKPAPALVIANDAPKSTRMRATFPHLARYFVDRPISAEDLRRALRLT
jgi:hypothetical protein